MQCSVLGLCDSCCGTISSAPGLRYYSSSIFLIGRPDFSTRRAPGERRPLPRSILDSSIYSICTSATAYCTPPTYCIQLDIFSLVVAVFLHCLLSLLNHRILRCTALSSAGHPPVSGRSLQRQWRVTIRGTRCDLSDTLPLYFCEQEISGCVYLVMEVSPGFLLSVTKPVCALVMGSAVDCMSLRLIHALL